MDKLNISDEKLAYLRLLAREYPTVRDASREIINLKAVMGLPKGTEHFISDIHGEYEAFTHIINSSSGVIKEKLDIRFGTTVDRSVRESLATLIYYPEEKMKQLNLTGSDLEEWYRLTLYRLVEMCRIATSKYTRSKVRKSLPEDYGYVIDELLHMDKDEANKQEYYESIINTIIETGSAPDMIIALCDTIKRNAIERLHIVGDIFDRGPRADKVMNQIMKLDSVDIQWGNHDILWMGAACGSRTLIATVLANSIHYNNLAVIEIGYGISLRPLSVFANEVYANCDCSRFNISVVEDPEHVSDKDRLLSARMHKAITVILFKLEGQKYKNRPEFGMQDRLLLDKIDYEKKTVTINGVEWPLEDCDFPTVDPADPYRLTDEEQLVMQQMADEFRHSEKLQQHIRFLYSHGSVYKVYNGNLLLHGCVPMNDDGTFMSFNLEGRELKGKALLDFCERAARKAYYDPIGSEEREYGMDLLWFLWGGRNSPLFGRSQLTTFERRLIADKSTWTEDKNAYYRLYSDPEVCDMILKEFGLEGPHCHIINGHVPVKAGKGESPIKGGGKLLVIDGGFCKAYQPTSGIAGYTLISNSHYMRIVSHQPFAGKKAAVEHNADIANESNIFEVFEERLKIADTDTGRELQRRIDELMLLLAAYRAGAVAEAGN